VARDVEFDAVAHDKTAAGLSSAERRFRETGEKIRRQQEEQSKAFGDRLTRTVSAFSPRLGSALAAGLADGAKLGAPLMISAIGAGAPALAGILSAAVVGGIGVGGVVGGVALAARDPRVQAAGAQLGRNLLTNLEARAAVFVDPVLKSIAIIDDKLAESQGDIQRIFTASARFVEPLSDALGDFGQSVLRGVAVVSERAGPVMEALGDGVRETGEAIEGFLDDVSRNGEQTARVLDSVFTTLNGTLSVTGEAVAAINQTFAFLDGIMPLSLFETFNRLLGDTEDGARRTGSGTFELAGAMGAAEQETRSYADQLAAAEQEARDLLDANQSLYSSTTSVAEAFAKAKDTIAENGRTLSLNSEKGRENRDALSQVAGQLTRNYEAYVAVNGAGAGAAAVAAENRRQFIALATSAGASGTAANRLADELLGIPSVNPKVTVQGVESARAVARTITTTLNAIADETVNVYVRYAGGGGLSSAEARASARKNLAAGAAFMETDGGTRSAPPAQVNVDSQVVVNLDGAPFRSMTAQVVSAHDRAQRHRMRYGGRRRFPGGQ
jgi:hypothetical protein